MRTFTHQKVSGIAALIQSLLGFITLIVVLYSLGIAPNADSLAEIARSNPFPIVLLDIIKLLSSITALILINFFYHYFMVDNLASVKWGSVAGIISVICLLTNAVISLLLVLSATSEMDQMTPERISTMRILVIVFGIGSIFFNGLWYIAINRKALKNKTFPASFCHLGTALGVISLIPPLSQIVLVLVIVWSLWLGIILLREIKS
jgi:hypothetical protein